MVRALLKFTSVLCVTLALLLHSAFATGIFSARFPVMQGMTNAHSTQFTVLRKATEVLSYQIVPSNLQDATAYHLEATTKNRPYSDWVLDKIVVENLLPERTYFIQILDAAGQILDQRQFSTIDLNRRTSLSFIMASCMNDSYSNHSKIWQKASGMHADFIFMIGDTVYADWGSDGTEIGIWQRYIETRLALGIFRAEHLTPVLATWDDHDFGKNDAFSDFPLKHQTKLIFENFFLSSPTDGFTRGPGVSSHLVAAGQQFFFMDDRTWRSRNDLPKGAHWGSEQEDWLFSRMTQTHLPTWVLNGSQFFGGYSRKDSFERWHPLNLKNFSNQIQQLPFPIVLGSGDVHYSEIMELEPTLLGYKSYEVTSSSMHGLTIPLRQHFHKNSRRITSTWRNNFIKIDSQAIGLNTLKFKAVSHGVSQILFQTELQVSSP